MVDVNWKLEVGQVRTSNEQVRVVCENESFFALEVDLDTKYADPYWTAHASDEAEFVVGRGADTLRYDIKTDKPTVLTVTLKNDDGHDWTLMQEVTRYTWRMVGYKRNVGE